MVTKLTSNIKRKLGDFKIELEALYLASKDSRTPRKAKILIILTIAYALSPIDLIPDFIPVIGQIDDLIIIPAGIAAATKLIPRQVIEEYRQKIENRSVNTNTKYLIAAAIIAAYALILYLIIRLVQTLVL